MHRSSAYPPLHPYSVASMQIDQSGNGSTVLLSAAVVGVASGAASDADEVGVAVIVAVVLAVVVALVLQ